MPHMPFHMLMTLLLAEVEMVHMQMRLVSESKIIRHQEKKCRDLQRKINNLSTGG